MAINEACPIWIKDYGDKALKKGKSKADAVKELHKIFKEDVGIDIKPETIRKKEQRASKKVGTNVPMCKRCGERQIIKSRSTGKPMDHDLCQVCRSDDLKKGKEKKKPDDTKNGKVIKVHPPAEKYWKKVVSRMDELLMKPVFGAVGSDVLRDVLQMRDRIVNYVEDLEKDSKS